jgi:hypothetical protein
MRHTIPFDTHAYVKKLTAAGVPEAQAEVHAGAIAGLVDDQLATKRDLAELELRLNAKLEGELRKQLLWFFGMPVVLASALVALLKLLLVPGPHS